MQHSSKERKEEELSDNPHSFFSRSPFQQRLFTVHQRHISLEQDQGEKIRFYSTTVVTHPFGIFVTGLVLWFLKH